MDFTLFLGLIIVTSTVYTSTVSAADPPNRLDPETGNGGSLTFSPGAATTESPPDTTTPKVKNTETSKKPAAAKATTDKPVTSTQTTPGAVKTTQKTTKRPKVVTIGKAATKPQTSLKTTKKSDVTTNKPATTTPKAEPTTKKAQTTPKPATTHKPTPTPTASNPAPTVTNETLTTPSWNATTEKNPTFTFKSLTGKPITDIAIAVLVLVVFALAGWGLCYRRRNRMNLQYVCSQSGVNLSQTTLIYPGDSLRYSGIGMSIPLEVFPTPTGGLSNLSGRYKPNPYTVLGEEVGADSPCVR